MDDRLKRPPSVWLTQSLLIIFALLFLFIFLLNLTFQLRNHWRGFSMVRATIGCSIILGIVLLLLASFWSLAKRKALGRWLGIISLTLLWCLIILVQLSNPSGPYKYYEYNNTAELVGAAIFQTIFHGLFLLLILRLAFAKRVIAFFQKKLESS